MRLKSLLVFIHLLFVLLTVHAQTKITGKIIDENAKSLNGATVIVKKDSTASVLAYAISENSGDFSLNVNSEGDSLILKISYIGYEPFKKIIKNENQHLQVNLKPSSESLREVIVESKMLEQRGDTLSFSVDAFKGKEDRVIADVLKKIPGIEIMPNGQIEYQGEPIQKYYIEGLDLLEGRYNLANENLNVDAVSKVEILENHQPIKVLDSLEFSERASLNIKLKKDVTLSGTAEAGLGASPLLWKAKVTPMIFTKDQQAIITYQANNTGNDLSREINDFSFNSFGSSYTIDQQNWVSLLNIPEPPFSEERWLDNNAHLGSVNFLTRIGKDYQLKTNISYLNDSQLQEGSRQTSYFTPNDTIAISEVTRNNFYINKLTGKLTLEKNVEKDYLKNQLEFKGFWNSERGNLQNLENTVFQRVNSPFKAIKNTLDLLKPIGKQLITFNSNTGFKQTEEELVVNPGQFPDILNNNENYDQLNQLVNSSEFFTDNSAGFTKALGQFTITPKIGFSFQNQQLNSRIRTNGILEDSNFRNQLDLFNNEVYFKNAIRFKTEDEIWNLRLSTPLTFKNIKVEEYGNDRESVERLLFEPSLYLSKKLSASWETSISGNLNYNFGEINRIYPGYIISNYRNIQRYDAPISERQSQNYSYSLSFRKPLSQLFATLSYRFSKTRSNLLFSSTIADNGSIILNSIAQDNFSNSHNLSLTASKYVSDLKSTLKINGSYSLISAERILNEIVTEVENQNLKAELSIDSEIFEWLSANYDGSFNFYGTALDNTKFQQIKNHQHFLSFYIFLADNQYLDIAGEYYGNSITEVDENYFLNLGYQYTFGKSGIDLNVSWNNILNTEQYINVSSSDFSYIQNTYRLRPSQILASLKFSF
ncbi:carboxypeptidase-like regulatory domain-containing protein [Christiangramia sp. SM2212]|uniref:Carboxypeptidase-like regulatory domain-containing protein n=1 Tax=Christiangramia sediminicola TaxID=3073267 RepID=A0ABU1ELJ3_9FLAO|nr:carboxypeptidase-like regulatory domain-containing protein [Christiangramia sp. SM2212]MDR5589058.1 carboxypeptidase-like regulatory domain-containing protein [Christiangramia sp. SM2212]